ncbi:Amino acid transporter, transmembrane [Ophiocordyceps camponoti-floridani]|uniref:Amino acid transporter, transmembrane n=1 Tax=Ophiocordyceps camponoti-floridani TaxID=2030778 RepID=A0A8H4QEE4_9HYPO|nr:Amino acid transporter, transmembrane [Ophiocordyceps camponoti-floridani]
MGIMEYSSEPDAKLAKSSSEPREETSSSSSDNVLGGSAIAGEVSEFEERRIDVEKQKTEAGDAHFHRLGWKRLTVILIVEAVALGSLSLPAAFATLGMVAGVVCCVGLGLIAIYTSDIVGQVKLKYPEVAHYADAGRLLMGRFGYELVGAMFVLQLTFLVGSHTLTGTIAFLDITNNGACSVVFGFVSAVILLLLAIPPSFAEVAILGYIDFVSILAAIGITLIATGIIATDSPGGLAAVNWSAWPKPDINFAEAFIAIANIVFAYSFCMCQFSFMDEMHTPGDYLKSIWTLGIIEIIIYTVTGAVIYAFVGIDVKSPALLSAGPLISKIAFGVALPVIFISGSINTTVVGRYIHGRIFRDSVTRFINTPRGWITWLAVITVITIAAFVIAEVIPFFSDLLSISSSLFVSGFTFYIPAMMWYKLLRVGPWYSRENLIHALMNGFCFIIGIVVLVCGTYGSIDDIIHQFSEGKVRGVFACAPIA